MVLTGRRGNEARGKTAGELTIWPSSTVFSPRITYKPRGTSAKRLPTMTRSRACSRTRLANWSKERMIPMIFRPSRSTTSILSAQRQSTREGVRRRHTHEMRIRSGADAWFESIAPRTVELLGQARRASQIELVHAHPRAVVSRGGRESTC